MRYDAVFLDVDRTLLWVDVDVEGYVEDLAPYSTNGTLTVEEAHEPLMESLRTHISQNINYPTEEELANFRRENARKTAEALGLDAPTDVLVEALEKRLVFKPYSESEEVMEELVEMGIPLYVVSNWDVALEDVLGDLGWTGYFDGVIASARSARRSRTAPSLGRRCGSPASRSGATGSYTSATTPFRTFGAPPHAASTPC